MPDSSKVITICARKPAASSQLRERTDPFKPLNAEEKAAVRISFYDCGRSVRSIARMLTPVRAESMVEETLRDAKAAMSARERVAQNIIQCAEQMARKKAA